MKSLVQTLLNRMPMRRKLLLSFFLVICIPILVSLYLMQSMKQNVMNTAVSDAQNSLERVDIKLSQIFDSIDSISADISYRDTYYDLATASYSNDYERVASFWKSGNLSEYLSLANNNIQDIRYYIDQYPVLDNGYFTNTPPEIRSASWYQQCSDGICDPFWLYLESPRFLQKGACSLTLLRPVYYRRQFFGVLSVSLNQQKLNEILDLENYHTLLITGDGTIVSSPADSEIGLSIGDIGLERREDSFLADDSTVLTRSLSGASGNTSFLLLSILPTSAILEKVSQVSSKSGLIVCLSVILAVLFLLLFSELLTRRLSALQQDIHRAAGGDFRFCPKADGSDEIARLSLDFEKMLQNTQNLIDQVYLMEIQKQKLEAQQKEIQLHVLNSQINPHFLFNALESIRMKAVSSEHPEIASAIRMLSSLLRKSLYAGSDPIPLSDELDLVRNYLELQKFRFPTGFSYAITPLCDIQNQMVPPFTLQPLAENCFRHGFEAMEHTHKNNFISITMMREDSFLILRIADNGYGMDSDRLESLRSQLAESAADAAHIGIRNVHQRIRLIYGSQFGLSIASELHKGTVITIRLPFRE